MVGPKRQHRVVDAKKITVIIGGALLADVDDAAEHRGTSRNAEIVRRLQLKRWNDWAAEPRGRGRNPVVRLRSQMDDGEMAEVDIEVLPGSQPW